MMTAALIITMLLASMAVDAMIQPRPARLCQGRSLAGSVLQSLIMLMAFGIVLAISGHLLLSVTIASLLLMAIALGSNAKYAVLGEPLLFTDLALVGAVVKHPQFYFSALPFWQILLLAVGGALVPAMLAWAFVPAAVWHLFGLLAATTALAVLALLLRVPPWRSLSLVPDTETDVHRHGLLATMVMHWARWRQTPDPPICDDPLVAAGGAELVVIVQCESFADPVELFGDPGLALPGLVAAQANARQWGNLHVSGFGAYTMRTEYGVLFGRSEVDLGFRRFDPFLTALGETSHALPARLRRAGWRSVFVHPHDMGFYGRDRIMAEAGFDELLGEASFAPPVRSDGRYVTDAALATKIIALAGEANGPTLIYAVSIENHGPWPPDQASGGARQSSAYLRLVGKGDIMLERLATALGEIGRPALLVFFGDHRPSIPGLSGPGGDRHTPYVVLRFGPAGRLDLGKRQRQDLSPAGLHRFLLEELRG